VPQYILWHYTKGFTSWIANMITFIAFEFNFFSVKELLLTLFSPFQRLKEKNTGSIIDIENIMSILLVNITMRAVGFLVRSVLLMIAFVCIVSSVIALILLTVLWLMLPFLLFLFTLGAIIAYFKYKP